MGTDAGASSGGDVDLADIPIYDSMTNGVGNKQGYNTEDSHIEGGHGAVQCTTEDRWTDNGIEGEHEHESPKPLVRELSDEIDVPSSAAELAATERANFQSGGSHKSGSWSEDDGGPLTPVHFPTSSEIKQSFNVPDISLETNGLEERNNNFQDGEEKVFNPFSLPASMSQKTRNAHISEALGSTSAVELSLACREVVRRELFVRNNILVVILGAGIVPNSWEELYRTEAVKDTRSPEFVRKIPLPASTELDRDAEYNIRVYNFVDGQSGDIGDMEYIGETTTSIRALMNAPHMTMEKSLTSPRNRRVRGYISICLDIILHEEKKEATTFDFGFTECAPMRNRIFFVVSRALKKGAFSPIYRSEVQTRDQLSKFDDVTLSSQVLHGGNASRLFRLEVYRYYKNYSSTLLGFVQTSLEKLKTMNHGGQLYWWPAVRGFPSVNVKVINVKLDEGGQTQGTNWFCLRMTGW